MTDVGETKIEQWLMADCFCDAGFGETGGGIQLKTKEPVTGRQELVKEYPVKSSADDTKRLAMSLFMDAVEEAEGHGNGTHAFVLYAYRNGEQSHFTKRTVMISVEGQEMILGDEERTAHGLLGQTQRHLEATMRINAQMLPSVVHGFSSIAQTMAERLHHLESTNLETLTLMKELYAQKQVHDLDLIHKAAREARMNAILDRVVEFAPVILPKLLPELLGPPKEETKPENTPVRAVPKVVNSDENKG